MLHILATALFQIAAVFAGAPITSVQVVSSTTPAIALTGGTGGWTGDIALTGGTGGWTGDIA